MITKAVSACRIELKKAVCISFLSLIIAVLFFSLQLNFDNLFEAQQPYMVNDMPFVTSGDTLSERYLFLIDGWQAYDGALQPWELKNMDLPQSQLVSIATHNNARNIWTRSGQTDSTTYKLVFYNQSSQNNLFLSFGPEYARQKIWLNGLQIPCQTFAGLQSVLLPQGKNELVIVAKHRYLGYDKMLTAPWVSNIANVQSVAFAQYLFYSTVILVATILGVYILVLWQGNPLAAVYRDFSFFCFSFAIYCADYFLNTIYSTNILVWEVIHQAAFLFMGWYLFCLTAKIAKFHDRVSFKKYLKPFSVFCSAGYLLVVLLATLNSHFSKWFVIVEMAYKLLLYIWLMFSCLWSVQAQHFENEYLLAGAMFFSSGLWISILHRNNFTPIYSGWQMEWCGLAMVLTYGYMVAKRNRRILQENEELNDKLLEMVGQRTVQLSKLLEERKQFFSEIVHDLKAPIAAVNTFVTLIRKHSVGVDDEMLKYLDMVQQNQNEMARRVQVLNEYNKIDNIIASAEPISLRSLLQKIYDFHNPEAEVLGVRMELHLPIQDEVIFASKEKLHIVFENLIYNALSFTEPNDVITISATKRDKKVVIWVSDTGYGIAPDILPRIFERFFVGRENKAEGNGLGLYIARQIIHEANGEITAVSKLGEGTTFTIEIPVFSL